jgi:hypothetical protein
MTTSTHADDGINLPPATRPRHFGLIAISVCAGAALAILWSFEFADSVVGDNVANTILGHEAKAAHLAGPATGLVFAFVTGLAGTFTACNIAMVAAVGPMSQAGVARGPHANGMRSLVRPIGWLTLGMVTVSAAYGAIGVLLGDRLPQLSTATAGAMPVRLIQSSVVFGVIGLILVYLGLATLRVVPDVFAGRPIVRVITMGALIGGFLIGRPYPLFHQLFRWAVEAGNPALGAVAFVLQSLGNIAVVTLLFVLLSVLTGGRVLSWLTTRPDRLVTVTSCPLIALGVFTFVYWDVRLPAMFGIGWFPSMPYN